MTVAAFWRAGRAGRGEVRLDLLWLVGLVLVMVGAGLGLRDPWPADEPRFALIAQDMVRSGDWFVPRVGGDLYQDKPPVYFWLMALALTLTGSLRTAFLLPSLLATIGTVVLAYDLGRRLWNRETGLAAGFALVITLQFIWQGRQAQIDATLCFLVMLGLYGLLRHLLLGPAWRWFAVGCAASGLGVITKGVGFVPLLVLIPYALVRRGDWQPLPRFAWGWRWTLGPAAFLAAVSIWLLPMLWLALGDPDIARYRDEILFQQTIDRYAEAWHHHEPFWYFLVEVIPLLWLPLTALVPWLVPRWRDALRARDLRILLLLAWVGLVVLFFSLSAGKRGVYVLPAVPAVALAVAPWLAELAARRGPLRILFTLACLIPVVLGVAGAWLLWGDPARRVLLQSDGGIDPVPYLFVMAAAASAVCAAFRARRGLFAFGGVVVVLLVLIGFMVNPVLDPERSGARFARQIEAATASIAQLGLVAYKEQYLLQLDRPTYNFGHARWREWEQEAFDAAAWLAAGPGRGLLVDQYTHERCFRSASLQALDEQNRKEWFLVTDRPDPECVMRGNAAAARLYDPPPG